METPNLPKAVFRDTRGITQIVKKILTELFFYHGEKFLDGLLKDITQQSIFDKCELIFVDTASPGKEREIIEQDRSRIRQERLAAINRLALEKQQLDEEPKQ